MTHMNEPTLKVGIVGAGVVTSGSHLPVLVNLPGISGPELLEHLRRAPEWRAPPVILMSAQPGQPLVQEALARAAARDEAVQFIAKPFDVDDLVDAVAQAVAALQRTGSVQTRGAA